MWPWLVRLLGGWLPIGTKPLGEWLGKIIWVTGVIVVWLVIYHKFTQATTVTNTPQTAKEIVNNYNQPKAGFGGCASTRVIQYYHLIPLVSLQQIH